MAQTIVRKDEVLGGLVEQWRVLADLLADAPAQAWERATCLPGWTVRDVAAHIIGTEELLAGRPVPDVPESVTSAAHVRNPIGALNERWVESMRADAPEAVLARFRAITAERAAALAEMSQADFDADAMTPVGQATYGRFMRVRAFDCWYHELDLRDALEAPGFEGGPRAELAYAEISGAIPVLVGKRAGAPDGARVRLELTGDLERTVNVAVDGRAGIVAELDREPDVTLRLPWGLFARLGGGRVDAQDHMARIAIAAGSEDGRQLGERLAHNLRFTP